MSIWAYKVITSGKGGFATPALLETFLNQLGADEWEIIHFHTQPDNPLAFTGLARRPTQRDWTLEDAVAAAARAEGDKLRAEFEAKFKGGAASAAEEKPESSAAEKAAADDGLRRLRNTERDLEADGHEEGTEADEWEKLSKEDELPTFFEAIQPLMRRNQRGEGLSVGVDHLAKKWGMSEDDVVGALKECGFMLPEDENTRPVYVEYDGDLYWVNVNRRGELWINTKEKGRPVFRVVPATPVKPADEETNGEPPSPAEADSGAPRPPAATRSGTDGPRRSKSERAENSTVAAAPSGSEAAEPLPPGPELLEKIRPLMRRNRRGPGGSGSLGFLSRALKCGESDLLAGFSALGLALPASPEEKPLLIEIGNEEWWLNKDQRGGIWINGTEKNRKSEKSGNRETASSGAADLPSGRADASSPEQAESAEARSADSTPSDSVFSAVRLLLKPTKTGALAGRTDRLAETLGKSLEEFLAALTGLGLKIPEKAKEKPVFVEHAGEIFWLNKNAKDELWLNAKASKFAAGDAEAAKKPRRGKTKAAAEPSG